MKLFVDPTPITSRDLSESEMAGVAAGAVPAFVVAVVKCAASFGAVVIAAVDIAVPD